MSFLADILASRRERIAEARGTTVDPTSGPPLRAFRDALAAPGTSLIAEFKRASPSRGVLRDPMDPAVQAKAYESGGARALSVLVEPDHFLGSPDDLRAARDATSLPVLWKDFVIDPWQAGWARSCGADAVLVIVRIVDDVLLREIMDAIERHGMTPVVEVFDERDLQRALDAGADVIGVNHRDLQTFEEDPGATARLRPLIPDAALVAGFSAIWSRADVEALEAIGVDAILVGEALVRSDDPAEKIRELLGGPESRPPG